MIVLAITKAEHFDDMVFPLLLDAGRPSQQDLAPVDIELDEKAEGSFMPSSPPPGSSE